MSPALACVALAYVALTGAWLMSSRPFTAPDETAHYLRALTITQGHIFGFRASNSLLLAEGPISPLGREWQEGNSRALRVPASLSPPAARCLNGTPDVAGSCVESTYTGTYQPLPYLLPAGALAMSGSVHTAGWLARAGAALPAVALLLVAIAVLWDGTAWSLLGYVAAVTPMTLFVSSVLNPSGLEIAACIAFLACLLRLARGPAAPWPVWIAAAVSGSISVLAWQLGPLFVALDVALCLGLTGAVALRRRRDGRRALATGAALLGAVGVYAAFVVEAGGTHTRIGLDHAGDLHAGVDQLGHVLEDAIGTFGNLSVPAPAPVLYIWWLLIVVLVGAALLAGTTRQRLWLLAGCAAGLASPVLFYALVYKHTGFGLQGRYMLPVMVMAPLLAGEILRERQARLSRFPVLVPGVVISLVAVLQLAAWWSNARVSAGRVHALWFLGSPAWAPPGGWWPWTLAALLGTGLLAAVGALAVPHDQRARRPERH